MKKLSQYIKEDFKLKKKGKISSKEHRYKYFPKTKQELAEIITDLIINNGADVNLNIIDVSNITDMSNLFSMKYGLTNFIGDISEWDVSNVTNMERMFNYSKFNGDISDWDVSSVLNMDNMFDGSRFDGDLSGWDVSKVTSMKGMFKGDASEFTGEKIGFEKWDVSSLEDASMMFSLCHNFTGKGIENWNVKNLKNARSMFNGCSKLNCDLSKWNTKNLIYCEAMFADCIEFNSDLSNWNVSNLKAMTYMFFGVNDIDFDFSRWNDVLYEKYINKKLKATEIFSPRAKMFNAPKWIHHALQHNEE